MARSMRLEDLYTIHSVTFCTMTTSPVSLELAGICTHCTPFKSAGTAESKTDCIHLYLHVVEVVDGEEEMSFLTYKQT